MTGRMGQSTGLLDLAGRLVGEVSRFVGPRFELFKAELKQDAADILKNLGLLAAGAVAASLGVVFLLLALGLWVGDLVGSTPGGLAIVGGGLALIGAGLGLLGSRSFGRQGLVPHTVGELRRDVEWIQQV